MRIGEVARLSDVSVKTIRYYEEIDVLPQPARSSSGYRQYEPEIVERLAFIKASQAFGLSPGEIREIVGYRKSGEVPCAHVLRLLRQHTEEVENRIAQLQKARNVLGGLVERAQNLKTENCLASSVCHLIPRKP